MIVATLNATFGLARRITPPLIRHERDYVATATIGMQLKQYFLFQRVHASGAHVNILEPGPHPAPSEAAEPGLSLRV